MQAIRKKLHGQQSSSYGSNIRPDFRVPYAPAGNVDRDSVRIQKKRRRDPAGRNYHGHSASEAMDEVKDPLHTDRHRKRKISMKEFGL